MYDSEFENYLAEKTGVDLLEISDLFEQFDKDVFQVAKVLINLREFDKAELGKIWASYMGFAYVDPNTSIVNEEFLQKAGVPFIMENKVIPLYKFGRAVTVATSNPINPFIQDKVEKKLGEIVSFVFCFPFDIENFLRKKRLI